MTEERAEYLGSNEGGEVYEIREEAPHNHFTSIPNIIDDGPLSVYAFRLYCHLKRVAGDAGKCWQSTATLAKFCGMSAGKVSEAKIELETHSPPLIRITSKKKEDGRIYHEIAIIDIWLLNNANYTGKPVHQVKGVARSPGELYRSPHETKKNPLKQEEPLTTTTGTAFKVYESEIGPLTPIISQEIGEWLDDPKCPAGYVVDAIQESARQNKRNWSYIRAILRRWKTEGKQAKVNLPNTPRYPNKEPEIKEFIPPDESQYVLPPEWMSK